MHAKVLFQGSSLKGTPFIIRYIQESDLVSLVSYINALSHERTFIRYQGETITVDEEEKYIAMQLKKIEERTALKLVAVVTGKIIATAAINLRDRTERHEGVLGISVAREYRGLGIGKVLLKIIIDEAQQTMSQLRIVTLDVFATNAAALKLYHGMGFKEFGRLPNGIMHNDSFVDKILMYRDMKSTSHAV